MNKLKLNLSMTVLMVLVLLFTALSPASADPKDTVRVWVSYKEGKAAEVLGSLQAANGQFHFDFPELSAYVVTLPAAALNGILNNPHVLEVEEDAERYPIVDMQSEVTARALEVVDPDGDIVPYGIDMVQARDVWDANRDGVADTGAPTGSNRTLCIIDSGYYQDHEDLPNATGGYSQVDDNWARDGFGHGSHVGGTITAQNNGLGVIGVTPGTVNLYIVKFFADDGNATYASNLVDALSRCRTAGANVVSMSLGGSRSVNTEKTAFANAEAAGVLSIAAAGNEGTSALSYPASYTSVVSVAAIDVNKVVADFSQYNSQVELAAPGVAVLSTLPYVETNSLSVGGVTYAANHIEYSGRGSASGVLVDGGLCGTAGSWTGKVVLCERGTYDFYTKVMSVQNGGGVAAVIYNNVPGGFLGTLGEGYSSTIVGISLSQEDGQYLVANKLGQTGTVSSSVAQPASGYEAWDGTSMATPHVSAVAALVWSSNPSWTNTQIRQALTATAQDLGIAGRDVYFGYGLVQAKAALDYLGGGTPPVNNPPDVTVTSPANNTSFVLGAPITFTATATDPEQGDLSDSVVWKEGSTDLFTGASFSKADLALGMHVISATVTDAEGASDSASVSVTITSPVTNQLLVTVSTNKTTYINGEKVAITVTVKDQNGVAVSSAAVSVKVSGTIGSTSTLSGTTGTGGTVLFSYRINTRKTGTGSYTLVATATKSGYEDGSASATFLVQ
ncbi:MAG: S8 family serine peptidase [Anaerolineaceae bacterium]